MGLHGGTGDNSDDERFMYDREAFVKLPVPFVTDTEKMIGIRVESARFDFELRVGCWGKRGPIWVIRYSYELQANAHAAYLRSIYDLFEFCVIPDWWIFGPQYVVYASLRMPYQTAQKQAERISVDTWMKLMGDRFGLNEQRIRINIVRAMRHRVSNDVVIAQGNVVDRAIARVVFSRMYPNTAFSENEWNETSVEAGRAPGPATNDIAAVRVHFE